MNLTWAPGRTGIKVVNWTKFVILLISILAAPLEKAQVKSSTENPATMSEREQRGLRGQVKSCAEQSTPSAMTDAEGTTSPEVHSAYTTELRCRWPNTVYAFGKLRRLTMGYALLL